MAAGLKERLSQSISFGFSFNNLIAAGFKERYIQLISIQSNNLYSDLIKINNYSFFILIKFVLFIVIIRKK